MTYLGNTTTEKRTARPALAPIRFRPVYRNWGKRLFDLPLALVLLVFAAPALLVLAGLITLDGGRPVFAQLRVGRGGRLYPCYKLRTMAVDAEARLACLLETDPAAAAEWAENQKLSNDPRITRLGGLLRKTSLDELPQLWNVIRGDMSLIGPRPVLAEELKRYGADAESYIRLRPGITGAWQVSGRNSLSYDDRVRLDVEYERRLGFARDLWILIRTAKAVLWATGK